MCHRTGGRGKPKDNRQVIEYTNSYQSKEYVDNALSCGPLQCTLSGAGRERTVDSTGAAVPSEQAVEEMRDWSIECKI